MKMRTTRFLLVALAALAVQTHAQTDVATTIGEFLLIEPSARIGAMGNAGSSISTEPMAAYYNPASLGSMPGWGVQFTHSRWLADIAYDYAIATVPIGASSSGMLNFTSLRSGDIAVRTVDQPLGTGENYSVNDLAIGLGYGVRITDKIAAGLQLTYVQETIWHSNTTVIGLNFGTQYRLSEDGIMIGASLSNFGTRNNFTGTDLRILYAITSNPTQNGSNNAMPAEFYTDTYGLPLLFRVGIALPVTVAEGHDFLFAVDAFHPNNNTESVSLGGEYTFSKTFSVRAGYQNLFEQDSEAGLTLGAGVLFEASGTDVHFDYGWTQYGRLGNIQRMTVGFTF